MPVPAVEESAAQAVRRLTERGRTVAVAESLTGGLVVAALVGVPGASKVVRGGVVAYMTDLKTALLGVDPDLLARSGAVDREVALAMARGVADRLGADYGVATTGVAGPDPQDGHPVGELWVATWGPDTAGEATGLALDPALGRDGIRRAAVAEALSALVSVLGR
jgi:nicotinamide-nucleotide amidase